MTTQRISVELNSEEALVLFDYLSQFEKTGKLEIRDSSEEAVLMNILCVLEEEVSESFSSNYSEIILEARNKVKKRYGE